MGSGLYHRAMDYYDEHDRDPALQHKVWDGRPWIVNAYTGRYDDGRDREMMSWCRDRFGEEAWPIHGRPGRWYRGGATIHGWTWFGFETQSMMDKFSDAWPAPADSEVANAKETE